MIATIVQRYLASSPPESDDAKRELAEAGVDALPALLEAIRTAPPPRAMRLSYPIAAMEDRRVVPLLIDRLREDDSGRLASVAESVIARIGGPGAFEYFAKWFEVESTYAWAPGVHRLARLGDHRAIPILHAKLAGLVGEGDEPQAVWSALDRELDSNDDEADRAVAADDQSVVARLVEALARLADFRRTKLVDALYRYPNASAKLRQAAGHAAQVATDHETFALGCQGIADPAEEVRYAFAEALYFLGVRGAATVLAERLVVEPDSEVTGCIVRRLRDLVGTDDPDEARAIDATFIDGVCYRNGAPIDYAELARLAASDDDFAKHELYLRTGGIVGWIDYPMKRLPLERRLAEAEAWIANEAPKFERGAHYRAGVRRHI